MAEIKYIAVQDLYPHPDNPRKELGDLTELADSIRISGVLQNLTVVPRTRDMTDEEYCTACEEYRRDPSDESRRTVNKHCVVDGYTIIIGHRRHAAAKLAGVAELPCIVVEMSERDQLQTMLVENMQRSDLTVYEQAQGFQMMLDMGVSVEEIAKKSGFSQTTVRRRVKMMELDQEHLKEVSERQISLSDFDRLAQIEDIKTRNKVLKDIGTYNLTMPLPGQSERNTAKRLPQMRRSKLKPLDLRRLQIASDTVGNTTGSAVLTLIHGIRKAVSASKTQPESFTAWITGAPCVSTRSGSAQRKRKSPSLKWSGKRLSQMPTQP